MKIQGLTHSIKLVTNIFIIYRFPAVQCQAVNHFLKYDLDALFIVTHAPGQSAYNIVERRMAPLSHDLAGLILPHEHYGTHLNKSLKCIDTELEMKNFSKAGHVLAEVWSNTVIDGEPVVASYIEPDQSRPIVKEQNERWKSGHLRSSQYLLQIVKCDDNSCCKPKRSTITQVMPSRFILSPVKFGKNEKGVFLASINDESAHFGTLSNRVLLSSFVPYNLPFDYFCPSIQPHLNTRTCNRCNIYHSSQKSLTAHKRFGCLPLIEKDKIDKLEVLCEIEDDEELGEFTDEVPILPLETFISPLFEQA